MMTDKRIRVIKQAERDAARPVNEDSRRAVSRRQPEETKRDSVAVVSEWVRELRQKKAEEALQGFEGLFGKAA